VIKVSVAGC